MKLTGSLLFIMLLAACDRQVAPTPLTPEQPAASQSQSSPSAATSSAQQFWTKFRAAVLAEDAVALQSMARFPFTTLGITDEDASVSHDATALAGLLPTILAQDVGLSAKPESVRQYLERNPKLPKVATGGGQFASVAADATQFSAGPLTFEKVDEQWYWVSATLEE